MSIFREQIARPIGAADMEFYESVIVLRLALILSGHTEEEWDGLTHTTKSKWLDKGTEAACRLFNDADVVARLPLLARNLTQRMARAA